MRPRAHYEQELESLLAELQALGATVTNTVEQAVHSFQSHDIATAETIIANDNLIDRQQEQIEQHVMQLIALQQPVAGDLRRLLSALEISSELERIGDYAKRIAKATLRQPAAPANPPELPLEKIGATAVAMLRAGVGAFIQRAPEVIAQLEAEDNTIDELEELVQSETLALIKSNPAAAEWALDQALVAHTLERVGDRVTNVAEQLVFATSGERVDLNP